jgi:hypothetical protein
MKGRYYMEMRDMIMHTMAWFDNPSSINIDILCVDLLETYEPEMTHIETRSVFDIVKIGYDCITGVMGLEDRTHKVMFIRHKRVSTSWTRKETNVQFNHPTQIEYLQMCGMGLSEYTFPLPKDKIQLVTLDNVTKMSYVTLGSFLRGSRSQQRVEMKIKYLENGVECDKEVISISPPTIIFDKETIDPRNYIIPH